MRLDRCGDALSTHLNLRSHLPSAVTNSGNEGRNKLLQENRAPFFLSRAAKPRISPAHDVRGQSFPAKGDLIRASQSIRAMAILEGPATITARLAVPPVYDMGAAGHRSDIGQRMVTRGAGVGRCRLGMGSRRRTSVRQHDPALIFNYEFVVQSNVTPAAAAQNCQRSDRPRFRRSVEGRRTRRRSDSPLRRSGENSTSVQRCARRCSSSRTWNATRSSIVVNSNRSTPSSDAICSSRSLARRRCSRSIPRANVQIDSDTTR